MNDNEIRLRIKEIFKTFDVKPIIFAGAGISKRYLNLPNWIDLLSEMASRMDKENQFIYRRYENKAKNDITYNRKDENYLLPLIASYIEEDYNRNFFESSSFEAEIKEKYEDRILAGDSPFKIAICEYIKQKSVVTSVFNEEINGFKKIENKISNFVTTNYDDLFETTFKDYDVYIGQQDLLNKKISTIGNLFKIHGSIDEPSSIIINENDYLKFEEKKKFLSAKLLTYFLENPIIFLGYGINDNNIKSIFQDIKICLDEENANKLSKRLIFVDYVNSSDDQDIITSEISGLTMTKIKLKDYNILYDGFDSILDAIDIKSLRTIESKIVQLIQTTNPTVDRVYATSLENNELNDSNLAVFIGHESCVFETGYAAVRLINICEDILFQSKKFDAKGIIEATIPSQRSYFNHSKIPLYYYLKNYDGDISTIDFFCLSDTNNGHFKNIISEIDDLYSKSERDRRLYKEPIDNLSDIVDCESDLNKIIVNIYLCLKVLDIMEVKEYIKSIWSRKDELKQKTHLTKIVCAIDLVENK